MYEKEIIDICKRLYQRNMLAGADGNVSVRTDENNILITPSGLAKAFIGIEDFAVIDIDGKIISGKPSSEYLMHLEIYRKCDQAKAVIHAHPPYTIAWTIANPDLKELSFESLPEVIIAMGSIPIAGFAMPGTTEVPQSITSFLPKNHALVLARHGAVVWGKTLNEAINGIERIEHVAQMLAVAESLGGAKPLNPERIKQLRAKRQEIGDKIL